MFSSICFILLKRTKLNLNILRTFQHKISLQTFKVEKGLFFYIVAVIYCRVAQDYDTVYLSQKTLLVYLWTYDMKL